MRKLLGRFDVVCWDDLNREQQKDYDYLGIESGYLVNFTNGSCYSTSECIRTEGRYDGTIAVCNTAYVGVVLSKDGEQAVLQLISAR